MIFKPADDRLVRLVSPNTLFPRPESCWRVFLIVASVLLMAVRCDGQPAALGSAVTDHGPFRIAGQCVRQRTTEPIAGAKIYLIKQNGLARQAELAAVSESDERGRFEFTGLESPSEIRTAMVRYTLVCDAQDHAVAFQRINPHLDARDLQIGVNPDQGTLRGAVVGPDGRPIAGAKIRTWDGARLGSGMVTTSDDGRFQLTRLPPANAETPLKSLLFQVSCHGFPTLFARAEVPSVRTFTMKEGCTLAGSVRHADSGRGVADVVITALPIKSNLQQEQTRTDDEGNYQLFVNEGNYHILLEDSHLVAPAIVNLDCRAGTTRELEPMIASPGGWLTGRVVHPRTGEPVVFNASNQRLRVNSFGPATPKRGVIDGRHLAEVDDDGRFRIRVAAGDNYPYLVNIQAERMGWDTDRQPPVQVPDRGIARCFIKIKIKRTDEEKIADARQLAEELPENIPRRVEAILDEFRKLNHTVDQTELWCLLMKELVEIGDDAVPRLCRELDATDQQRMMRRLGFALRAINDPRAVPSLIRAIPKTLQPSMSDYGLIVADADLLRFMQNHDLRERQGGHFGFGRPIREIFGALNKITGQQLTESELYHIHLAKDRRARYQQQQQFQTVAESWRDWWAGHYQDFGVDESLSRVALKPLPPADLSSLPTGLQMTSDAQVDGSSAGQTLAPIGDTEGSRYFLDLDTGRQVAWPSSLARAEASPSAIERVATWARQEGVDLVCVAHSESSERSPFVLRGVGLKLWEIDPRDAANLGKKLQAGKLPEGRPIDDGLLLHFDSDSHQRVPKTGSCFLYLTEEDGLGIITITDFVTRVRDISGLFHTPKGVGFHRGVRFDWKTIAR